MTLPQSPRLIATTDGHVVELHLTPDRPLCLLVRGHGASIALDLTEGERTRLVTLLEEGWH